MFIVNHTNIYITNSISLLQLLKLHHALRLYSPATHQHCLRIFSQCLMSFFSLLLYFINFHIIIIYLFLFQGLVPKPAREVEEEAEGT